MTGHRQPTGDATGVLDAVFHQHPTKRKEYNFIVGHLSSVLSSVTGIGHVLRGGVKRVTSNHNVTFELIFSSGHEGFNEDTLRCRVQDALKKYEITSDATFMLKKGISPEQAGFTAFCPPSDMVLNVLTVTYSLFAGGKATVEKEGSVTVE